MDRFIDKRADTNFRSLKGLKSNMDRFIVNAAVTLSLIVTFKIQYGQIYRPRRFQKIVLRLCLKSNMDRFIALLMTVTALDIFGLKSNMDRFIAVG